MMVSSELRINYWDTGNNTARSERAALAVAEVIESTTSARLLVRRKLPRIFLLVTYFYNMPFWQTL